MASATMLVPARLCLHDWSQTAALGKKRPCCADAAARTGAGTAADPAKDWPMAARWHEGPADATLLTAFRGWASALLPVVHTTHIVRSFHSFLVPHLYSFRADTPRSRVPFCTE